jgi:hypothetical protein
MKKGILFVLVAFFLMTAVHAIGLQSDSLNVNINYVPNFQGTYYYNIEPFNSRPTDIEVYATNDYSGGVTADLAQYFKISNTLFKQVIPGESPSFSVSVDLPLGIIEPGNHRVKVGVRELAPSGSGFAVVTGIEAIFNIIVPFQGQYLKYYISAKNVNENESVPISLELENQGTDNISSVYATVNILDSNGDTVATTQTNTESLAIETSTVLTAQIPAEKLAPGDYTINATIYYDGKEETAANTFKVGTLNFLILNQTSQVLAGIINQMSIAVESQWADDVENVYAELTIGNQPTIRTLPETVGAFGNETLTAYFDATDLKKGIEPMTIVLYYENSTTTKNTQIDIAEQSPLTEFVNNLSPIYIVFIIAIIAIIVVNICLFIILMKKRDEHEKEE